MKIIKKIKANIKRWQNKRKYKKLLLATKREAENKALITGRPCYVVKDGFKLYALTRDDLSEYNRIVRKKGGKPVDARRFNDMVIYTAKPI